MDEINRRAFLAAAPVVAVAATIPTAALAQPDDAVTRYWRAEADYNAGRISEQAYDAALEELDVWEPPTLRDFVRKFEAVYADGASPNEERSELIMAQAKRLLRSGRA